MNGPVSMFANLPDGTYICTCLIVSSFFYAEVIGDLNSVIK
jgi:hypothetical protein